jgi:ADP-ribose pyrophosphatase YjhB (NUDIX family)
VAIRTIAVGVIRRGDALLVTDGRDPVGGGRFHRPLGGGVEFGEASRDTVVREFREELGAIITVTRQRGTTSLSPTKACAPSGSGAPTSAPMRAWFPKDWRLFSKFC